MTKITDNKNKIVKNKPNYLKGLVIIVALIIFGYFSVQYFVLEKNNKSQAADEVAKYDNVESKIFDLTDSEKVSEADLLSDFVLNDLEEKGSDFIYQILLKNQSQISDLKEQIGELKVEVLQYNNRAKIGKIILLYVELREAISKGTPHDSIIKNLEIITISDQILPKKISELQVLLPNVLTSEKLTESFSKLIPELIIAKNSNVDGGLLSEIRKNLSNLVIIRKIDEEDSEIIDAKIVNIEKLLQEEKYQEAANSLNSIDQKYNIIIKAFLDKLNITLEVQKIDQEILTYLKDLT